MRRNQKIFLGTLVILIILVIVGVLTFGSRTEKAIGREGVRCESFNPKVDPADGERIETIIHTMANTSLLGLAFKSSHLHELGEILDKNVPSPFTFLAYIFSHPKLVKDMKEVKQSSSKYNGFVEGLQKNMMKKYRAGCLYSEGEGFAKYLKLDPKEVDSILKQCVKNAENGSKVAFKPLVDYLIAKKS